MKISLGSRISLKFPIPRSLLNLVRQPIVFSVYSCCVITFTRDDLNRAPITEFYCNVCGMNCMTLLQMNPQMKVIYTRSDISVTCQECNYSVIIGVKHE